MTRSLAAPRRGDTPARADAQRASSPRSRVSRFHEATADLRTEQPEPADAGCQIVTRLRPRMAGLMQTTDETYDTPATVHTLITGNRQNDARRLRPT